MAGPPRLSPLGPVFLATLALGALVSGLGCDRLREKQAVRRYALDSREVERRIATLRSLAPELEAIRRGTDSGPLGPLLKDRLLPELRGLVEAIRRLPAEVARLRSMKAPLLAGAERALEALETLADRLGRSPMEGTLERSAQALEALFASAQAHGKALDSACGDHDLRRRAP